MLYKRFPILRWLPNYSKDDAVGDLVAGITVGLTVIPQALAYSGVAGLPATVSFFLFLIICMLYIQYTSASIHSIICILYYTIYQ